MEVFVRLKDLYNKLISIDISLTSDSDCNICFPTWRPGRYEQANYKALISSVKTEIDTNTVKPVYPTVSDIQLPHFSGKKNIKLSYEVFCNEINAGSSYVDDHQWYFNFINFIPVVKGLEDEPISINIDYPADFKVFSPLQQTGSTFYASNYYELVDAPFLASRFLETKSFSIDGTVFQLAINNTEQKELPWGKLLEDFTKLALPQKELFGSFPFKEFTYLIFLLPYKTYHGVEHKDCTVITIGPTEKALYGDWYKELLGVSSHELFHCWNVTRLRPKELSPYDFSKQKIHKTGFVTEGFTTYYGDLMLARAGVFSLEEYLEEMNTYLKRYLENPAYQTVSMVESSINLWANGYKPGPPYNHVSIYIKGALLALLLDLKLRENQSSLDELMLMLWDSYLEHGYSYENVIDCINQLQVELGDEFSEKYYHGVEDVVSELEKELSEYGLSFIYDSHPEKITAEYGVLVSPTNKVTYVDSESPVKGLLHVGDELLEHTSVLKIKRMGQEMEFDIASSPLEKSFFSLPRLRVSDSLSNLQKEKLSNWLKQDIK